MRRAAFVGATQELLAFKSQQHNRLLRLAFPMNDQPDGALMLPNRLIASEGISRDFRFDVEILSDNVRIPLKAMMGKMVTISLVREDGSLRHFNGYVTDFRLVKTDGGYAYYAMVLEPWLALSRLRKNSAVFVERSVLDITKAIFEQYAQRDWQLALRNEYPQIGCAIQYNETDHNHLHRRWEELGLHYWYEHREDGHTLWLGDNTEMSHPIDHTGYIDAPDLIPFLWNTGAEEEDGIASWQPIRRLGPDNTSVSSFDYKNPGPQVQNRSARVEQGTAPQIEFFETEGGYSFASYMTGEARARRRMEEMEARTQYFEAAGNNRTVQPGRSFRLGGHFSGAPKPFRRGEPAPVSIENREYLILSVTHTVSNNYQDGRSAESSYECAFTCMRKDIAWRPGRGFNSEPVVMHGVQTAIVVGPPGNEIYTDDYGRVKVKFHWDRREKRDDSCSAWVRVASLWAGAEMGAMALPRVGQEVAVQWIAGNPDHPLIIGRVFNRANSPPWDLPGQRALSGIRSRELSQPGGESLGWRSNHLILDDTHGQIQAQLKSDHQCSQLSLGHISRIEDHQGRQDARGEGWEVATDAWGVARAGKGILITTEARLNATSHAKDMGETIQRLASAQEKQKNHAEVAEKNRAQESGQQSRVATSVKAQNDAVRGDGASSANRGFPELSEPHLILASAAGIATTTAQSTHIASEIDTAITAGKSVAIAAGDGLFASVVTTLRLFVQRAGMKLIAVAGDIDVRALSDSINLLAKLNITQTANRIVINAKEDIVINGGGSYVKFSEAGIEHGTKGKFVAHAVSHSLIEPKSLALASNEMEKGHFDQTAILRDLDGPLANRKFELAREDGTIIRGVTGADGRMPVQKGISMATAKLRILGD